MKPAPILYRERGVILIVTLIALVILLITGVALIRSFDSSLLLTGNIAFKRDLINQGERGVAMANTLLLTGALADAGIRKNDLPAKNYSSHTLATNSHGIPSILMDDALWTTAQMTGADISDATTQITIRYVIDRLCTEAGEPSKDKCVSIAVDGKGGSNHLSPSAGGGAKPIYRVSVRVTGPRNAESYLQSTLYVLSDT